MPIASRRGAAPAAVPTIVLLENEVLIRMPLAEYLRDCGYRVLEATSLAEAHALLNARMRVDLVFTKVRLSGGHNGFALANWVRRHHPAVKVLLAATVASAAEQAGNLCATGPMLVRPSGYQAVLRRIQTLLHRARRAGAGHGRSNCA
jgi:DNA-binding response OmpR family regulator